ncbi:hybrid sensor histidine kinase/response regulator [Paracoccus sp. (in: a-proteobacteria)]|uniref:hybrid sensor histidine kinase/response regulator n=1 Tax=Paracoccus sp. TaxID=267 RepID=UPI00272A0F24|nr:ATP-binding protein [Paracoccus sp. (in: a-proteobacteria)]
MSAIRTRLQVAVAVLTVSIAVCGFVVWVVSADARRQIDQLATANSDSIQWSLAQSEVELLALLVAVGDARAQPGDTAMLAEVRTRFDILYSRMRTLTTGRVFQTLRQDDPARRRLDQTEAALDAIVPLIDGSDDRLRDALPTLQARVAALRPVVRSASLEGVRLFSGQSDRQREQVSAAMHDLALLVGMMVVAVTLVVAALAVMADRARRQAARIATTHARLRTVIATSHDAIVVADTDGRILDFNESAQRIYGYGAEEALGADMLTLIVPEAARAEVRGFLADISTPATDPGRPVRATAMRKSGEIFPIEVTVARAPSERGPVMIAFVRDVTRQVQEADELIRARDRAVAGERAKDEMLTVMSHEMRTPLNGLLGTLDLLSATPLNPQQRRYAEVMAQSGALLLGHVNSVLDIARADAGAMRLEQVAFDPHRLVLDLLEALQARARQRGNTLSAQMIGDAACPVLGDPARLTQILMNLIGNAIKFTEGGRITVTIDRRQRGVVEFRVHDTGIGIAPEDHARIFQEFVTLDPSFRRMVEGTGLGLGIVRRLTRLMDGDIRVESAIGQGACFILTVPLADQPLPPPVTTPARPAPPMPGPRRRVLVVEDNEVNRMVVREMLHARNCDIVEAVDGQQGVDAALAQRFDLIFMDISMPRMDGITAATRIRAQGPNVATPIIALTAHARPADQDRFQAAGMSATLTKPLSFQALDPLLDRVATMRGASPARDAARRHLAGNIGAEHADRMLDRILSEFHDGLARLDDLTADPATLSDAAHLAHRMAGSVALLGLSELRDALSDLESGLTAGTLARPGILNRLAAIGAMSP